MVHGVCIIHSSFHCGVGVHGRMGEGHRVLCIRSLSILLSMLLILSSTPFMERKKSSRSTNVGKYLDYLQGAGYIEFTEEKVTAYNAYANDAVIKLTKEGVDLAEGTVEDNGVDV